MVRWVIRLILHGVRKEGRRVLFNDALNTVYLRLYGIRWLRTILIVRKETSLCYTSRGALVGTRNSSMGSPHKGSIRRPIAPWANALTTELHLAPSSFKLSINFVTIATTVGVRCSSVVRAFAHGAMGHQIDPSWGRPLSYFSFQPVLHDWCNKGHGMCSPVCGMVHI